MSPLEVGCRVKINAPLTPGTGIVAHVHPPFLVMSNEDIVRYYGFGPNDPHFSGAASGNYRVERVIIERDEGGFILLPMTRANITRALVTPLPKEEE